MVNNISNHSKFSILHKIRSSKSKREIKLLTACIEWINTNHPKKGSPFTLTLCGFTIENHIFRAASKAIQTTTGLNGLNFHHCNFDEKAIEALSNILRLSESIQKFSITYCNLYPNEFRCLIEGLADCKPLKQLFLTNTNPSDDIFPLIASKLLSKKLEIVDFSNNNISDSSYQLIFKSVEQNTYLTDIRLRDNRIVDNDKIKQFGRLLQRNEVVTFAINHLLENVFRTRNIKIRTMQTHFSRVVPRTNSNSGNSSGNGNGEQIVTRARGGTINSNLIPPPIVCYH